LKTEDERGAVIEPSLGTVKVSATAYVGIDGFVDTCKFGANLVD